MPLGILLFVFDARPTKTLFVLLGDEPILGEAHRMSSRQRPPIYISIYIYINMYIYVYVHIHMCI